MFGSYYPRAETVGMPPTHFRRVRDIAVRSLRLDPENPRLPVRIRGKSQSTILAYLYEHGVLEELAQSYMDHGYFRNEPLIAIEHGQVGNVVIEGNRRLAALKVLLAAPEAGDLAFTMDAPEDKIARLKRVPCFFVSSRDDVSAYIGFRHIGGIKTWESEAKARYILGQVKQLAADGSTDPFRDLGRRVGSNSQGVRNSYLAIRILEYGREEFGLEANVLQEQRFGVWLRCMNSADIRQHIGLGRGKTYGELEESLRGIDGQRLGEVVQDLTPPQGGGRSVLGDSRNVTAYGRVLADEGAYRTLRQTNDLDLARKVIDDVSITSRTWRLVEEVKLLVDVIHRAEITKELTESLEELYTRVWSVRAILKSRSKSEDR